MIFIALTMLGYVSYKRLAVELFPSTEKPELSVQITSSLSVDPSYIEKQAIIPLESAINSLSDIDRLESTCNRRRGTITVYYNQNTNIKYAYLKLQEKLATISEDLPEEFTVSLSKADSEKMNYTFMVLQARGEGGVDRVRYIVDNEVVDKLEAINGIAGAIVNGGQEKTVEVIVDNKQCEALGIPLSRVQSLISSNNADKVFVGNVVNADTRYFVNVSAEYTSVQELENIVVSTDGPILLSDVAQVNFGVKDETSISRVNGQDVISIMLIRDTQVNQIDLSHSAQDAIEEVNSQLEHLGVSLHIQVNTAEVMEENINMIKELAIIGGLLAIFILWLFIRNFSVVAIVGLAMPISVFSAFNLFYAGGVTINSLTLVGLALAIGMLLDNSVVVLENIFRRYDRGQSAAQASVLGTQEVWRALIASTATTITVFLPFLFSSQYEIKLLGTHIGISIGSTLLFSLIVALLLIPMGTHFILSRKGGKHTIEIQRKRDNGRLMQIYTVLLKAALRSPATVVLSALIAFFLSIVITLSVSYTKMEEVESDSFQIYVTMPSGATLASADELTAQLEEKLLTLSEREDIISQIYEDEAEITVMLKEDFEDINGREITQIKDEAYKLIDGLTDAEIELTEPQQSERYGGGQGSQSSGLESMMGIGTQSETVLIKGEDFDKMRSVGEDIVALMEEEDDIQRASLGVKTNSPELHLTFDNYLMTERNITYNEVRSELNSFPTQTDAGAVLKDGLDEYDITIKIKEIEEQEDPPKSRSYQELQELQVESRNSGTNELQTFTNFLFEEGVPSISRVNQSKEIEISYRFLTDINDSKAALEEARLLVDDLVASVNLPSGVAVEVQHEVDNGLSEYKGLIGIAFLFIFMILASVFESLVKPFVVMFAIPLAAVGSFFALGITGTSLLNANVLTGFLILLGIVVNNSIILIDYASLLQKEGYNIRRSLLLAGQARLRPILITAITTIVAMVPMAMGQAEYASMIGAPFAITIIGGLSVSTLLTLVFVPTFYFGLTNALRWIGQLPITLKIINYVAIAAGLVLAWISIDNTLMLIGAIIAILVGVPASIYFFKTALRRAGVNLITEEEPITIHIHNLVKRYGRLGRFRREWISGKLLDKHLNRVAVFKTFDHIHALLWKLPLTAFFVYFAYFYLENAGLWQLLSALLIYALSKQSLPHVLSLLKISEKVSHVIKSLVHWSLPLILIFFLTQDVESKSGYFILMVLWYVVLLLMDTAQQLRSSAPSTDRHKWAVKWESIASKVPFVSPRKPDFRALSGVNIEIRNGMFGLLGPNGAGKTTMMRIICGILDQNYGKIWINGHDTQEKREELQGLIGYLPQAFGTYENMTAWDYLNYQANLKGIAEKATRHKRVSDVLEMVHMYDRKDDKIGGYSGGMKQRIGIAQILLHLPRILVVDEPTAGLDPRERIRFRNLLVELSRNRIVIFSTHIIEDISTSCNQVAVVKRGNLVYHGVPNEMSQIARGHVFEFLVEPERFTELNERLHIVQHIKVGKQIRVRCIEESAPVEGASEVSPNLEDAYLWMLRNK